MGMLAVWVHQVTTPLRDLRWQFNVLKTRLLAMILRPKALTKGVISDARQIGRSAGFSQKPKPPPKQPPPKKRA